MMNGCVFQGHLELIFFGPILLGHWGWNVRCDSEHLTFFFQMNQVSFFVYTLNLPYFMINIYISVIVCLIKPTIKNLDLGVSFLASLIL